MAEYVYGVVGANATPPAGDGIGGGRLRLIAGERAAALVSELPSGEVRLGRREMLTHARVLERALVHGTVLPMRLGVVMSDPDEVRQRLLDLHALDLDEQLREFDGKVEVRIRAVYEEDVLMREVVAEDREIAALRRAIQGKPDAATYYERIQLGQLVATAVERTRERDAAELIAVLADAALAVDEGASSHERVAVNASFLLDRASLDRFDKVVDGLAAAYAGRLRFRYTGPLPPHSFVELAGSA